MELKILVKKEDGNEFTHYWNNNGENFWDTCKSELEEREDEEGTIHKVHIETEWDKILDDEGEQKYSDPMSFYLGENFPNYSWVNLDVARFHRQDLDSIVIQMSTDEIDTYKNFYFKLIDGNNVMYYYCSNIKAVTDQNNTRTSWELLCELDVWASCWSWMHSFMKGLNVEIPFANKMADRFVFDNYTPETFTKGFWNDYIEQQWLCRTNQYNSDLYCYENQHLELEYWRWLNSEDFENGKTLEEYKEDYTSWETNTSKPCALGTIYTTKPASGDYSMPKESFTLDSTTANYFQNPAVVSSLLTDKRFNSNGKYRYLVAKVGSNTLPTEAGQVLKTFFQNIRGFKAYKYNGTTPTNADITFNGETIIYIPFIKGSEEDSYLKILNNTTYGMILAQGYAMGMPINDIPPTILGSALRKFNSTNVKNGGEQTIGDIVSMRKCKVDNKDLTCPIDIVSLSLAGVFKEITVISGTNVYQKEWKFSTGETKLISIFEPKNLTNPNQIGYYMITGGPVSKGDYIYIWNNDRQDYVEFVYAESDETKKLLSSGSTDWTNPYAVFSSLPTIFSDKTKTEDIPAPSFGYYYHLSGQETLSGWYLYKDEGLSFNIPGIPVIVNDFSHIPITLMEKKNDVLYGWGRFFEELVGLCNGSIDTSVNTIESEPLFYSPGLWKWAYYIDGIHKIVLTADMIDLQKVMTETNWDINLNLTMTTNTSYYLDILDIKSDKYPMTKIGMELMSEEYTSFPFTTEAYNEWLKTNQCTIETSKNAKDIDYKWQIANNKWSTGFDVGGSILQGAGSGAIDGAIAGALGGPIGAIGGGILGALTGGIGAGVGRWGRKAWIERDYKRTMELFNNQIKGMKNNLYSSPTTMVNPGGFSSGSLVYSSNETSLEDKYELFKLYTIPSILKQDIWANICWNGYQYSSQCNYSEYNNRVNFNIINCNLNNKSFMVYNYLKTKMLKLNPLFSQEDSINSFINRCTSIMRLFKCEFENDEEKINNIIKGNIELKREWVLPYTTKLTFDICNKKE